MLYGKPHKLFAEEFSVICLRSSSGYALTRTITKDKRSVFNNKKGKRLL